MLLYNIFLFSWCTLYLLAGKTLRINIMFFLFKGEQREFHGGYIKNIMNFSANFKFLVLTHTEPK